MTWSPEPDLEDILGKLIARGYQFVHPRDDSGEIVTIVGIRAHHSVVDVVRLDAEDDVTVMRVPAGEEDILEPRTVLWSRSGAMQRVVTDLLELSDDAYATASEGLANGCWIRSSEGRSKWLMATA